MLLLLLLAALTPLALGRPHRTFPPDEWLLAGLSWTLRPFALFGEARAAELPEAAALETSVGALRRSLARDAAGERSDVLLAGVLAARGRGAGGWPSELVLDCWLPREDLARLAQRTVRCGDDLIGFVRPPEASPDEQRLRVVCLAAAPAVGPRRRLLAIGRSARDAAAPEIRLIVEAGLADDPWPLRVLRAVPRDLDTWSPERFPYLVRTAPSELERALPEGLVLGRLEDVGYRERGFVLRRFVAPVRDPRLLLQVAIDLGPRSLLASPRFETPARTSAGVDLSTPLRLDHRRYLLRGTGLMAGAAVVEGGRCLGRVLWARGGVAAAAPLHDVAGEHVLVWLGGESDVRPLLVRGRGAGGPDRGRFVILAPADVDAGTLVGGRLFSSGRGGVFPAELLVGEVVAAEGRTLSCAMAAADVWPGTVEVASRRGDP